MRTFTASNGIEIEISNDYYLLGKGDYGNGPTYATAGPEGIAALREYFQHERDEQLGRWRDPKAPNFVTYHSDIEYVRVVNEATGASDKAWRDDPHALSTAKRYFAAHPEKKPWHDAAKDDIWLLDGPDHPGTLKPYQAVIVRYGETVARLRFSPAYSTEARKPARPHEFTAGRRIWPEDTTDE